MSGALGSAQGSIFVEVARARQNVASLAGDLRSFSQNTSGGFRGVSDAIIRNEQQIKQVGQTMVGVGALAGGAFGLMLNAASAFEVGMNRVRALTGATGDDFDLLKTRAIDLAKTTRYTATEISDGMAYLALAGFNVKEVYEAIPGTLSLAAAANMDLGRAADISSNILTSFAMDASQLNDVVDMLTYTFTHSNTTMEMLGDAFKYVAPVAQAAGLDFGEVAAILGRLSDAGIQGSMAGTTLRGAISHLLNPTKAAQKHLDAFGVSTVDASGNMRSMADILEQFPKLSSSSAGAMQRLQAAADGVGVSLENADGSARPFPDVLAEMEAAGLDTSAMMEALGGDAATVAAIMEIFGVRAGPGVIALLAQGTDGLRKYTDEINNSGGTAERVAKVQMEGLRGSVLLLKAAWEAFSINAMSAGPMAAVTKFVDILTMIVNKIAFLPAPLLGVFATVLGLSAAFLTLGGTFLLLLPRIARTYQALQAFQKVGGVAGALQKLGINFRVAGTGAGGFRAALMGLARAHPVLAGLSVAVGAFAFAYKTNFLGLRDVTDRVVGGVKSFLGDISKAFNDTGTQASETTKKIEGVAEATKVVDGVTVWTYFETNADGTKKEVGDIIESVANADGKTAQVHIKGEDADFWATIDLATGEVVGESTVTVTGDPKPLHERINAALEVIKQQADAVGLGFLVPAISAVQRVVSAIADLGGKLHAQYDAFSKVQSKGEAAFSAIAAVLKTIDFGPFQGVANEVIALFEKVGAVLDPLADTIRQTAGALGSLWTGDFAGAALSGVKAWDSLRTTLARVGDVAQQFGRVYQAALTTMADGLDRLAERFPALQSSLGALADFARSASEIWAIGFGLVAAVLRGDLGGAFDLVKQGLVALGRHALLLFASLGFLVGDLAGLLSRGLDKAVTALSRRFTSFGSTIQRVGGVIGGVLDVLSGLGHALGSLLRGDFSGVFDGLKDATLGVVRLLRNSAVLIPTLLLDAFRAINWGAVATSVVRGANAVLAALAGLGADAWAWLADAVSGIDWGAAANRVKQGLLDALKGLGQLSASIPLVLDILSKIGQNALGKFASARDWLVEQLPWLAGPLQGAGAAFSGAFNIALSIIGKLLNLLGAAWSSVKSLVNSAASWLAGFFGIGDDGTPGDGASKSASGGFDLAFNLAGVFLSKLGSVWSSVKTLIGSAALWIADFFGIGDDGSNADAPVHESSGGLSLIFNLAGTFLSKLGAAWKSVKGLINIVAGWLGDFFGIGDDGSAGAAKAVESSGSVSFKLSLLGELTSKLGAAWSSLRSLVNVAAGWLGDFFGIGDDGALGAAVEKTASSSFKFALKLWSSLLNSMGASWSSLRSLVGVVGGWLADFFGIGEDGSIGATVEKTASAALTFAADFKDKVTDSLGDKWQSAKDLVNSVSAVAGDLIGTGWSGVTKTVSATVEIALTVAGNVQDALGRGWDFLFGGDAGEAGAPARSLTETLQGIAEDIATELANIAYAFMDFDASELVSTLQTKITDSFGDLSVEEISLAVKSWVERGVDDVTANMDSLGTALATATGNAAGTGFGALDGTTLGAAMKGWVVRGVADVAANMDGLGTALATATGTASGKGFAALDAATLGSALVAWIDRAQANVASTVNMTALATGVATKLQQAIEPPLTAIVTAFRTFGVNVRTEVSNLGTSATASMDRLASGFQRAAGQARTSVTTALTGMVSTARGQITQLENAARTGGTTLSTVLGNGAERAVPAVASAMSRVVGAVSDAAGRMRSAGYSVGAAAGEGVAAGMEASLWRVQQAAGSIVAAVDAAMRAKAQIQSPSRLTAYIGRMLALGPVVGIQDKLSDVRRAAQSLVDAATPVFDPSAFHPNIGLALAEHGAALAGYAGARATSAVPVIGSQNLTFNITQLPGEDGEAFANRVISVLSDAYDGVNGLGV